MFPDTAHIRDMQQELDSMIQMGVFNITRLLKNTETARANAMADDDEDDVMRSRQVRYSASTEIEDEDEDEDSGKSFKSSLRSRFEKAKANSASQGRLNGSQVKLDGDRELSEQLVQKGVITRNMLAQLKKELLAKQNIDKSPKKKR